jgi:fucose permease
MFGLLLAIIYLAFISLGLPDSLLGSAWPVMYRQFGVPVSYAGIVTMIIASGTIISSLMSDRLTRRLGAGLVTAISVLMTAAALFGFSVSSSLWVICLWAVPYGLGAGAVDAALNNYVAVHCASRHMNWLHSFWGVGASVSPFIMSFSLVNGLGWQSGYRFVGLVQLVLTASLFLSLPLWEKSADGTYGGEAQAPALSLRQTLGIRGVKAVLLTFFSYCALETTAGLWASTYFVVHRGVSAEMAAGFASMFYLGITLGRLLCGFIADRVGDRKLIKIGIRTMLAGILLLWLPLGFDALSLAGLVVIGLGAAPVYPSIIHMTPANFGKGNSQAVIGVQMASAYMGSTLMPPLFGLLGQNLGMGLYPFYVLLFAGLMFLMTRKRPEADKAIQEQ